MNLFSERLKKSMEIRGVTAAMMSRDLDISRGRISSMTTGRVQAPRKDLSVIAKYLGISEIWLLNGEGEVEGNIVYLHELHDGELVKGKNSIRLKHMTINENHVVVSSLRIDAFPDELYFILAINKKSDGLYLLYKNEKYFLSHRVDNIINSDWTNLSEENIEGVKIIGYVDSFFNKELYEY
jgi:transcriptional regulator with XRE-family HTH domain